MDKYLNYEYSDYLNRYINGLLKVGKNVKSIDINFENIIHFGKGILRLSIEIEFFDFENLTLEEKKVANKYFYNVSNLSGSKYFSFTYQPNNSGIDLNEVRLFINYYLFSIQSLKNIKNIATSNDCTFTYKNLTKDSLFILIDRFFDDSTPVYYERGFEKKYKEIYNRRFEFDLRWEAKFLEKSEFYNNYNFSEAISINEKSISFDLLESLYLFLIKSETPYKFSYENKILIEREILLNQLEKLNEKKLLAFFK